MQNGLQELTNQGGFVLGVFLYMCSEVCFWKMFQMCAVLYAERLNCTDVFLCDVSGSRAVRQCDDVSSNSIRHFRGESSLDYTRWPNPIWRFILWDYSLCVCVGVGVAHIEVEQRVDLVCVCVGGFGAHRGGANWCESPPTVTHAQRGCVELNTHNVVICKC